MAFHEHVDGLKWIALKNAAEGVHISKLLGVSFDKGAVGAHELRWAVATIDPGGKFSYHKHPHPQCFYFIKGTGEVALDGDTLPVGPGSIVTLDDDEGHEVRNTGDGEMYLMEVSLFHAPASAPSLEAPLTGDAGEAGLALRLHGAVAGQVGKAESPEGFRSAIESGRDRTLRDWVQAVRPFSFTASVVPVLLGTVLGAAAGAFHAGLAAVALISAVAIHAGANMVSDYFDFRTGVDRDDTYGSSGVITGSILTPQEVLLGGLVAFALAAAGGAWLATVRGPVIVLLGVIGVLGGYFYAAKPFALKYRALGDLLIFALFGPLMVFGAYVVQTGRMDWLPLAVSVPVGLLVTAILHANNLRDIPFDRRAGIRTLAMLVGPGASRWLYLGLVLGAYLVVAGLVAAGLVHVAALAVVLSAPIAVRNVKAVMAARADRELAMADVMTAQLHMVFGLLLTAGVLVGTFL